jgi:hypothetical protein
MGGTSAYPTAAPDQLLAVSNKAAWLSLLFGIVALGMTLASFLPGSPTLWVLGAAIVTVLLGLLAISRRSRNRATNLWAPIIGILFALGATAITVLGVNVVQIVNSATGGILPTSSTTSAAAPIPARPVSPEPFVFTQNDALTQDGTVLQQIATALNQNFAGGNSTLGAGQAWPTSLKFTATQVLAASGTPLATVPAGHFFSYSLSPDGKSYTFTVTAGNRTETAVYSSATNHFTFACPTGDAACIPVH